MNTALGPLDQPRRIRVAPQRLRNSWLKSQRPTRQKRAQTQGFSLIELMVAVGVGCAVLLSVGAVIMAQIEVSRVAETSQRLRDNWSRLAQFIENEIIFSERILTDPAVIITTAGSDNVCGYASSEIKLALVQNDNDNTSIVYALKPVASDDRLWRGPNTLRRCSKVNPDGTKLSTAAAQVLADGVETFKPVVDPSIKECSKDSVPTALSSAGRNITVLLSLSTPPSTSKYTGCFGGQARVNPAYNFLNDHANQGSTDLCATAGILCGTGTLQFTTGNCATACDQAFIHQYHPSIGTSTILGSSLHEDVIYLPGNRADYTLYGLSSSFPCTRQLCTVLGSGFMVTISQGDVLIFQDGELRF